MKLIIILACLMLQGCVVLTVADAGVSVVSTGVKGVVKTVDIITPDLN
jgi:hypothetical protein